MPITLALQGVLFSLDNEAAALLTRYLSDVKKHLANNPQANDILEDVENRLAERLSEKVGNAKTAISLADVELILRDMGAADTFADSEAHRPSPGADKATAKPKPLFRDKSRALLGGVCAGLAEYFDVDVNMVRILTVVLALGTGVIIPAYFIMWLIVPAAAVDSRGTTIVNNPAPRSHSNVLLMLIGLPLIVLATLILVVAILTAVHLPDVITNLSTWSPAFHHSERYVSSDPRFSFQYPNKSFNVQGTNPLAPTSDGRFRNFQLNVVDLPSATIDDNGCFVTHTAQDQSVVSTQFPGRSFCVRTLDTVSDNTVTRTYHYTTLAEDKAVDFIFTLELPGDASLYANCATHPTAVCDSLDQSESQDTQPFNDILQTYGQ